MTAGTIRLSSEPPLPPSEATHRRRHLAADLEHVPDDALTRLQYLQPQVGCFNRCTFCSQHAGRDVWQLTPAGLDDLVAVLAHTARSRRLRIAAGRTTHRPGVLFPYLDNDIASYPYLDRLVEHAVNELGVQLRISTVGYPAQDHDLADMHTRIATSHANGLAGVRFSLADRA